ncbi:MAG TPA: S9 family peptidase [Ktedonobacteraceae bacterium]|nr:S9 family peptidase [Ktedonobacteraceae bacterium]
MIDNDDLSTIPQSNDQRDDTVHSTIQVPVVEPAPQPAPRPFPSVDDLLALRIASDPQISPDGSLIAFTIQQCDAQTNTTSSTIWLVRAKAAKGDIPWQITNGVEEERQGRHDLSPRWSPDGNTLAFLSDRSGTLQIYLLPMQGGEARQLTNLKHGITEYSWRPDGKALVAHSPWRPADDRDLPDTSNISVVFTRLDEQWDGEGYKQGRHQQLWFIPLEGEPVRLTAEPVDLVQSCWSPDGKEIAFCANRRPDPDLSVSMALWVLNLANRQMRRLTPEDGLAQAPAWSPDGQHIAYYYAADQTEASNVIPFVVDVQGSSAPRPVTSQSPNFTSSEWIIDELHSYAHTRPQWYPDSKALLATFQERGQLHLYHLDMEHDTMTRLTGGNGCYLNPQLSKDGQIIAVVRTDWFTPGDIWSMDGNGQNSHKLTGVNDTYLRSLQLVRPKRITWQSFDGLEIEGWLYLPPLPEGTKAPLILEVHGGPNLAWGDSYVHEFQVLAGKGFAVLAANPRGSSGYGEAFCRKNLNDWGGDDFRDLMAGIDHVIATEMVEANRLGIGGISYGGYMTNWAITQTNRFKAAVSRNGISYLPSAGLLSDQTLWFDLAMSGEGQDVEALRRSSSPLTFADKITTPLLLLHAADDLRCPFSESLQMFVELRKRKQKVELVRYPGASHLMDWPDVGSPLQRTDRLARTVEWFERYV